MEIYHNPRCQKSRQTLAIIESKGLSPEIVLYLEEKLTQKKIKELLLKLNMEPQDIVRKSEAIYKEQFKGKTFSKAEWIKILIANPKLIERPIVVNGSKAVLGRPPENVNKII